MSMPWHTSSWNLLKLGMWTAILNVNNPNFTNMSLYGQLKTIEDTFILYEIVELK